MSTPMSTATVTVNPFPAPPAGASASSSVSAGGMLKALRLEVGKLRRKHYWLIAASTAGVCLGWCAMLMTLRASGSAQVRSAALQLSEFAQLMALLMPIVTAVLASRIVSVDAEERMGQLFTALGQRPMTRYRAKLVIVFLTVIAMETAVLVMLSVMANSIGLTMTDTYWNALGPMVVELVCSTLAICTVQLTLSTCLDKQAIGLGAAAIGGFITSGLPFAHLGGLSWLLPWGIVPAATPIDGTDVSMASLRATGEVTLASHPWLLAGLAVLAAAVWSAAAYAVIVYKENHR